MLKQDCFELKPLRNFAVELQGDSVIRNFRITATDGKPYNTIIQDRLFLSDYDKFLLELEEHTKKGGEGE
jgi:hypothetical protein